ncbi:MAG TPA: arginine--tRNA ligase [Candidatus Saccharimonadales bacterium]|nr:arginine--tRNA ligase [Candidatus Saccharimonadales bacterium]
MKTEIEQAIARACQDLFDIKIEPVLTRPDEQFGDYATNVALQLGQKLGQNPRIIAEKLSASIKSPAIKKTEVAGPGFINIWLSDESLLKSLDQKIAQSLKGQVAVAEYSDPNPFKVLHAGHLYTSVVGDAIANLLETAGAEVHRVNFGGDVGLHVAKSMWAIIQKLGGENPNELAKVSSIERADWLSQRYVEGNDVYEDNDDARRAIVSINKRVYDLFDSHDKTSDFAKIYWTCRQWSYDYFNEFYEQLGTKFEKYYPESETAPIGLKVVKQQLKRGVYKQSDGAVVFDGERYDLHTRVFINSEGLPTYEAKDVGLIMAKWQDYHFDKSVVITGNDIVEYMKVVLKSIEQFEPELVQNTIHLTHGMIKLAGGTKMSSRKGNVLKAQDLLDAAAKANQKVREQSDEAVELGAVKYAFLKQRMGADIIYDPDESVSLQGNSGPYLQYAHARACSILAKAKAGEAKATDLQADERSLTRKISEFTEVVDKAVDELMPHHICTYLYELAQTFNHFYEKNRVIDDKRQTIRIKLVKSYADVLKNGLGLLSINAPEKM